MPFEHYITQGQKRLRCGYTTGSCAALAAKAATQMLLCDRKVDEVTIQTPKGLPVTVTVLQATCGKGFARCAVRKDAGDDCDVTDGALIFATVATVAGQGITVDGGVGVGRVTKKGMDQPVGAAAINTVPRRMIAQVVEEVAARLDFTGGLSVLVEVPEGERLAAKTFNPRLGITGGISILGTSGIVEPQSLQALADSIEVEVRVLAANGHRRLIVTPGNYGEAFLGARAQLATLPQVKCANFIGDTLDFAAANGFEELLVVGHIGKLVKLAGGIMNTHSRYADCRTELFALHAALCGASVETMHELLGCATADACIAILQARKLFDATMQSLLLAAQGHLEHRVAGAFRVGLVIFSNAYGLLAVSNTGRDILNNWGIEL